MKKITLVFASIVLVAGMITFSGCQETDTGTPVITLTNDDEAHNRVEQFSVANYTDPGATVVDDNDKDLVAIASGSVNMNSAGEYTITYTATDKAGNSAEETRTVTVDGGLYLAGSFLVEDFTGTTSNGTYPETITASSVSYNRINFTKFAFYVNGTVYGTLSGTTITIPAQTVTCGNPAADRLFTGTATYNSANQNFTLNYSETTNGNTITGHGVYTLN
ncbi:MAG TPA: DUF5011 domain-containing protein [Bacteroidales bacterium]|nr:DUF5011 domain-containing protein [Bacteroidales bacterium]